MKTALAITCCWWSCRAGAAAGELAKAPVSSAHGNDSERRRRIQTGRGTLATITRRGDAICNRGGVLSAPWRARAGVYHHTP